MKKSLVALATLSAIAGAAQAQSNVTLYGLLDVNLSHYSVGDKSSASNKTVMQDGVTNGLNGSRWGIRTKEDLGGGLNAGAVLESGFNVDTGASGQGGLLFGRQVFVSLNSATAGELRLGRQYVLSDSVIGQGNPFGNALVNNPTTGVSYVNGAGVAKSLPYFLNPSRANNVLQYETTSFGGLTAAAQYAPGEGTADNYQGLRLAYAKAPFYVGAAYEWNKDRTTGDATNKALSVSANYDFGSFKILGGLQRSTDLTTTSGNGTASGVNNLTVTGPTTFTLKNFKGYTVGVEAPVASATVLGVNYTVMNYEGTLGETRNIGKIALAARYGLSKNTFLYGGVSFATGDLKDYISEKTVVQAGVRTAF